MAIFFTAGREVLVVGLVCGLHRVLRLAGVVLTGPHDLLAGF